MWRAVPVLLFVAVRAIWVGSKSAVRWCTSSIGENALTEAACGNLPDAESFSGVVVI